ncbi:hypothetical protein B484DRAFT_456021 [Ochromonadaceae sp. CCMP2298]|nr:hypothetical protein B484DRAFT_456021 [Ochromonadaceae sp. CCMP2298]
MIKPNALLWITLLCALLSQAAGSIEAPNRGASSAISTLAYASRLALKPMNPKLVQRNKLLVKSLRNKKILRRANRMDQRRKPREPRYMDAGRESGAIMDGIMESVIAL